MSYQVLARKWRPTGFTEVFGQGHVTRPLENAIKSDRVPHAILLTGPRGVGKTTIARILARCLNCEKGPTPEPCGACTSCSEIAEGRSTDVQEVDAASRTSVDDVREIIESIRYAPSPGKHRIFVVDEVHMLSTAAFNALLKTLEEPPPRSLFVLATTNPEKIPFTVVSRCQRYDLRRIPAAEVTARLSEIADAESVEISEKSLREIARAGDGSLRDSLTLLDQVLAVGGQKVSDAQISEVLDLIDSRLLLAIAEACIDGDAAAALVACGRAGEAGIDAKRLGEALLGLLRDLVVLRIVPDPAELVEGSDAEIAELLTVAQRCEPARLRRMFRALVREQEDLSWAPEPFAVLEMAVVRLATLPEGDDVARLIARLDVLERGLGAGGSGGAGGAPPAGPAPASDGNSSGPPSSGSRSRSAAPEPSAAPNEAPASAAATPEAPGRPDKGVEQATAPEAPAPEAPAPEAPAVEASAAAEEVPSGSVFDRLRVFAQQANRGLFAGLEGGRLVERTADCVQIALPAGIGSQRLLGRVGDLEEICSRFFGQELRVELEVEGTGKSGGARAGDPLDADQQELRRREALNHPAVNTTLEILGAEIVEIRPLGESR